MNKTTLTRNSFLTLALGLAVLSTGCLSIGGRTEVIHENMETEKRIVRLENRLQVLEHYAGIAPAPGETATVATTAPSVDLTSAPEPGGRVR